jgi:hypothetical protein
MDEHRTTRAWIWAAVALQLVGLVFDGVWHGLLRPGIEPATIEAMRMHLLTVHLPIYLGVLGVVVTTAWAFVTRMPGAAVAFGGAVLGMAGEAWHAAIHMELRTHGGPTAEGVAAIGLLIVITTVALSGRRERRQGADVHDVRRAA